MLINLAVAGFHRRAECRRPADTRIPLFTSGTTRDGDYTYGDRAKVYAKPPSRVPGGAPGGQWTDTCVSSSPLDPGRRSARQRRQEVRAQGPGRARSLRDRRHHRAGHRARRVVQHPVQLRPFREERPVGPRRALRHRRSTGILTIPKRGCSTSCTRCRRQVDTSTTTWRPIPSLSHRWFEPITRMPTGGVAGDMTPGGAGVRGSAAGCSSAIVWSSAAGGCTADRRAITVTEGGHGTPWPPSTYRLPIWRPPVPSPTFCLLPDPDTRNDRSIWRP